MSLYFFHVLKEFLQCFGEDCSFRRNHYHQFHIAMGAVIDLGWSYVSTYLHQCKDPGFPSRTRENQCCRSLHSLVVFRLWLIISNELNRKLKLLRLLKLFNVIAINQHYNS